MPHFQVIQNITDDQYLVYSPILPGDTAYLYVAFSVNESTRVKIQWKLEGPESYY